MAVDVQENNALMLEDLQATAKLARKVAALLTAQDCVLLSGDLGAGKTTFAQYLIGAVAVEKDCAVQSPTFTLVQTYPVSLHDGVATELWHADLYRIESAGELAEIGLEEILGMQPCVVEWPERVGLNFFYGDILHLSFFHDDACETARYATMQGHGRWLKVIPKLAEMSMIKGK